jgi:hypothetical protein
VQELIDFLRKEFPEGCTFVIPQFDRINKLEFEWKPQNEKEFMSIVEKAPYDILKGLGFSKWDEDGLILFPAEWYDIIPDGFIVTDIFGEQESFKNGETDDDKRFGCLSFGIKRTGDVI